MALANAAFVLASAGKRVLVIDWDLEAPGLHRYFKPFLSDPDLSDTQGLIDYIWHLSKVTLQPQRSPQGKQDTQAWLDSALDDFVDFVMPIRWPGKTRQGPLKAKFHFMPAGQQGRMYSERVNSFDWDRFYSHQGGGVLLQKFRAFLQEEYDYVLIDSRTGVSDTAGICTVQLPDALAVFFTLNNQSIMGAHAVAESVKQQQETNHKSLHPSGGIGHLMGKDRKMVFPIYPVPTRVDDSEKDKLEAGLAFAHEQMDSLLEHIPTEERDSYWSDVEFPYKPYYAYEEVLAVFRDTPGKHSTLLASAERLVKHLTQGDIDRYPGFSEEEREQVVDLYTRKTSTPVTQKRDSETQGLSIKIGSWVNLPIIEIVNGRARIAMTGFLKALGSLVISVLGVAAVISLFLQTSNEEKLAYLRNNEGNADTKRQYLLDLYAEGHRDFSETFLPHAHLEGLYLDSAIFQSANLTGANLAQTSLMGATMDYAVLSQTNLSGTDFQGASLRGVYVDSDTRVKDSTDFTGATIEEDALRSLANPGYYIWPDGKPSIVQATEYQEDAGDVKGTNEAIVAPDNQLPEDIQKGDTGYIWIGDYDRTQETWTKSVLLYRNTSLALGETQESIRNAHLPYAGDPGALRLNTSYIAGGPLTMRGGLPNNDGLYYKGQVKLGVLLPFTEFILLEPAVGIDREFSVQYWVKVEVTGFSTAFAYYDAFNTEAAKN